MTGYGRHTGIFKEIDCSLEIKSVNSRYQDISIYVPRSLSFLELSIRGKIQKSGLRGKIIASLNLNGSNSAFSEYSLNKPMLESYISVAAQIKENYDLHGDLALYNVMNRQEIVTLAENQPDEAEFSNFILSLLKHAMESLEDMEIREGDFITNQFKEIINSLKEKNIKINDSYIEKRDEFILRYKERIQSLMETDQLDTQLLHHEIVVLSDKLDISEEIQRFNSHIEQFERFMNSADHAVGKKMNFLLQELNREATTMGNKANDSEISHMVVEMKNDIEMIREQVQNLQ